MGNNTRLMKINLWCMTDPVIHILVADSQVEPQTKFGDHSKFVHAELLRALRESSVRESNLL